MKPTPRRAREIARTRQDILEAAARAFVHNGFKAATMQDIAKEAGYTAASLYSYFASKEEIVNELQKLIREEVGGVFDAPFPAGLSFHQKLDLLFQRHAAIASRRSDLFAVLHLGTASHPERCMAEGHNPFEWRVGAFMRFLEEHATSEDLGGRRHRDVALLITGVTFAFFVDWMAKPNPGPIEEGLPVVMDLIQHGIRGKRGSGTSDPK